MDHFPSKKKWIETMSKYACTIEIVNGPGLSKHDEQKIPKSFEKDYLFYLSQGFRLAPTADHDNHHKTWGTLTTARTGIIAPKLTKKDLLEAIRARHVYATTDSNLEVVARVNGKLCGDELKPPPVGSELEVEVAITDRDEAAAAYTIDVFVGALEDAKPAKASKHLEVKGNGTNKLEGSPPWLPRA